MNLAFFDHPQLRQQLLPFTYTRPVAEIRVGALTIAEKWQYFLTATGTYLTRDYLAEKFPGPATPDNLWLVNGSVCPHAGLAAAVQNLQPDQALVKEGLLLAARVSRYTNLEALAKLPASEFGDTLTVIARPWHIFKAAGLQIRLDYTLLTRNRESAPVTDEHTIVYGREQIFLEEGVAIKAATLNAENGPIYLGKNTTIEEGAIIRGPFALGEGSTINAQARMRGDIAIGPKCKVGGEVSNSVIFGHSNKGHDGFLGNSVVGEWCNIGAATNTSNLKNNYANVKVWDYAKGGFIDTGELFCGLMMGDHSKCGINTMFNTGTLVGVATNIFGAGFPRTFIPSFAWGGASGFSTFRPQKVKETATIAMARREGRFDAVEESILNHIFAATKKYRTWED